MNNAKITFVINGNTYSISSTDKEAINSIPASDKQALIALLESVKQQDQIAFENMQQRINKAKQAQQKTIQQSNQQPTQPNSTGQVLGEKPMGAGDVDNVMARLMLEEKRNQKQLPTKNTMYKWMAIVIVVLVLLFLIF